MIPSTKMGSLAEDRCRQVLIAIFPMHRFGTVRPDWLRNPDTGYNLELDCYSAVRNLALEYNGEQHYRVSTHFDTNKIDLAYQKQRDAFKKQRCKERGVYLIIVKHTQRGKDIDRAICAKVRSGVKKGIITVDDRTKTLARIRDYEIEHGLY